MSTAITYSVDTDGICTLTLDLPGQKMNVLGAELMPQFDVALARAAADSTVRGIIITSGKPSFVAGADLKSMGQGGTDPKMGKGERVRQFMTLSTLLRRMETCGKPVACAHTPEEKQEQRSFFFWYKPEMKAALRASMKRIGLTDLAHRLLDEKKQTQDVTPPPHITPCQQSGRLSVPEHELRKPAEPPQVDGTRKVFCRC